VCTAGPHKSGGYPQKPSGGNDSDIVANLEMPFENPELAKRVASKAKCDLLMKFN